MLTTTTTTTTTTARRVVLDFTQCGWLGQNRYSMEGYITQHGVKKMKVRERERGWVQGERERGWAQGEREREAGCRERER